MKYPGERFRLLMTAAAMSVLILDTKTALSGAQSGLELCLRVVVPSLFPFLFLSVQVNNSLTGTSVPWLKPLGRLCRIPLGAEGLLLIGLIGGYPVGAQAVTQAWRQGTLANTEAKRMLGFCSNAGPAFLFGMLSGAFPEAPVLWCLWIIHILSAISTGMILPGGSTRHMQPTNNRKLTLSGALERSIRVMASICGWVILFRVLLAFFQRWFLWALPEAAGILFSGLTELTNGCCRLSAAVPEGMRFMLASVMLSFGGVCVGLQTVSVTADLGTGAYFPGKVIQTVISAVLAWAAQYFLFSDQQQLPVSPILLLIVIFAVCCLKILQKPSSILARQGV